VNSTLAIYRIFVQGPCAVTGRLREAQKDAKKLGASGLKKKALLLRQLIQIDPYTFPPEFE